MIMKVLPAVRSALARKLVEKHGFSQKAAAERLGITQPAISQYRRELRGRRNSYLDSDPNLSGMIDNIADRAASGSISPESLGIEFCRICKYMISSGMACEIHRKMYPSLEKCRVCFEHSGESTII